MNKAQNEGRNDIDMLEYNCCCESLFFSSFFLIASFSRSKKRAIRRRGKGPFSPPPSLSSPVRPGLVIGSARAFFSFSFPFPSMPRVGEPPRNPANRDNGKNFTENEKLGLLFSFLLSLLLLSFPSAIPCGPPGGERPAASLEDK